MCFEPSVSIVMDKGQDTTSTQHGKGAEGDLGRWRHSATCGSGALLCALSGLLQNSHKMAMGESSSSGDEWAAQQQG